MTKKINTKLNKLIKYYSLINHNLIYNNQAINRYKNNINPFYGPKCQLLNDLRKLIAGIKNCELKKSAKNLVFADGNPKSKIMLIGEGHGAK